MSLIKKIFEMEKAKEEFIKKNPMVTGIGLTPIPGVKRALESFSKEEQLKGKKEGYVQASKEYETKLLKQAEKYLEQATIYESQKGEYEKLLDMYERYIDEMEGKENLSDEGNEYLKKLMSTERKLRKIGGEVSWKQAPDLNSKKEPTEPENKDLDKNYQRPVDKGEASTDNEVQESKGLYRTSSLLGYLMRPKDKEVSKGYFNMMYSELSGLSCNPDWTTGDGGLVKFKLIIEDINSKISSQKLYNDQTPLHLIFQRQDGNSCLNVILETAKIKLRYWEENWEPDGMDRLNERTDKLLDMEEDEFIDWLDEEINLGYNFGSEAAKITAAKQFVEECRKGEFLFEAIKFIFWSLFALSIDKRDYDKKLALISDFACLLELNDEEIISSIINVVKYMFGEDVPKVKNYYVSQAFFILWRK